MVDCYNTDSALCDNCKGRGGQQGAQTVAGREVEDPVVPNEVSGLEQIARKLGEMAMADDVLIKVMQYLKGQCIYCELLNMPHVAGSDEHLYAKCMVTQGNGVGIEEFHKWKKGLRLTTSYEQCFKCGLSQRVCQRLEGGGGGECEYGDIMMPRLYALSFTNALEGGVKRLGF